MQPNPPNSTERTASRWWFLVRFLGISLLLYALSHLPWIRDEVFPASLRLHAALAVAGMGLMGVEAVANGTLVVTASFALEIRRGCDAWDPMLLLVAAISAFPARVWAKVAGIGLGVAALLVLNVVRVISLHAAGVYRPGWFETLHLDVWQPLFLACTLGVWLLWAGWARRGLRRPSAAE